MFFRALALIPVFLLFSMGEGRAQSFVPGRDSTPSASLFGGQASVRFRGRLFLDTNWLWDEGNFSGRNGAEIRAARVGIQGRLGTKGSYILEGNLSGGNATVTSAYVRYQDRWFWQAGQFKTPNSLEEQTSSQYIFLMERASMTDAFDLGFHLGVMGGYSGANWTVRAGAFKSAWARGSADDKGTALAARATMGPRVGASQVHLGASFRYRNNKDTSGLFRYRQRPHQHLAPRFIATDRIADEDMFYGLELAVLNGPLIFQGEWAWLSADRPGADTATFNSGYAGASWFAFGGARRYAAGEGRMLRPRIPRSVFDGGPGALEVNVRFDRIDLATDNIAGGNQDTFIFGLTWWLGAHARAMVNYSRADVAEALNVPLNGPDGRNEIDGLGLRLQIDW